MSFHLLQWGEMALLGCIHHRISISSVSEGCVPELNFRAQGRDIGWEEDRFRRFVQGESDV